MKEKAHRTLKSVPKMALENISNAPEVCSDMLRIAPGALHIKTFLGEASLPPIKCQNRSEDTKISNKNWGENSPSLNQPINHNTMEFII